MTTTAVTPTLPPAVLNQGIYRKRKKKRDWTGWAFMSPFMTVFTLVFVAPIIFALYLSVHRTQLIGGTSFVGFDNYIQAFNDPRFWSGVSRVALFLVVQVPVMLGIALLIALALDSGRLYGKGFFRISIFMPYAVPGVVAVLMWGFMYGTRFGLTGDLNSLFGWSLDPLHSNLILPAIGNIVTWQFVGYNMLIFYSALKVVDSSLYEAAAIDGASQMQIIRKIKIPAIRGGLMIATIFSIIGSFQLFNEPAILQPLSPNRISTYYTPNMFAFNLSFAGQQTNYAAAVAVIMGVFTMIVAYVVQTRGMRKDH
jgi:multiple sugar transport system permease protein